MLKGKLPSLKDKAAKAPAKQEPIKVGTTKKTNKTK